MCGIMGYVAPAHLHRSVLEILIQGLKKLEYRGYDSSGMALFDGTRVRVFKSEGRFEETLKLLKQQTGSFENIQLGIGHTRWATHGGPTTRNAHPHQVGPLVIVHNGIIENDGQLRREILSRGGAPTSETDSELFAWLVLHAMQADNLSLREAVRTQFLRLQGQSSFVVLSEQEPGVIIGVRQGSPLVVAEPEEGGAILASDPRPLLSYQRKVTYLHQGDLVELKPTGVTFYAVQTGKPLVREPLFLDWSEEKLELGHFPHFMLKEIHEQPQALLETIQSVLQRTQPAATFEWLHGSPELGQAVLLLQQAQELILIACGTSWHVAWLAKYWIEKWARLPVSVELASEFRYRSPVIRPGTVVVGISQSGETADTLAALREAKAQGLPTLGMTNVRGSSLSREVDAVFYTAAGMEVGVASTKAFFAQMAMVLMWAGHLSCYRLSAPLEKRQALFESFLRLPALLAPFLEWDSSWIQSICQVAQSPSLAQVRGFFFLGRGYSFPLALEGALKLKEISYEHAEGYPAGELKHGPLAMMDSDMVAVVLAPPDAWREKTLSNLQEVRARGAQVIGVGAPNDEDFQRACHFWLPLPVQAEERGLHADLFPFFVTPVLQLFSYYRGVFRGNDVDKPRHLAKSVTVE